jgi:Ca-activated chloride channel family protein
LKRFIIFLLAVSAITIILLSSPARCDSPGRLVKKGNSSFEKGDLEDAGTFYERASVKLPESPIVEFNIGNVNYMEGDYEAARTRFENAAMKSRDLSLEARAWYNTGNCAFRQGQRQIDSDMEKALEYFQESVRFYGAALEKDPEVTDAAHNLEVARLVIKDLLDRIKKQQDQQKQQQDMLREVVDSLLAAIDSQEGALNESRELAASDTNRTDMWKDRLDKLRRKQVSISESTGRILEKLSGLFPQETPEQVQAALAHLDSSMTAQEGAERDIAAASPSSAEEDQEESLAQMKKALEKLLEGEGENEQEDQGGQQQQQQGQEQQQPEQQPEQREEQEAKSETAREILEEEKENREKRKRAAGGYRKVDKDW